MTGNTNKLFLALCLLAIYLNFQVWVLGLDFAIKVLASFLSNSLIVMFGLYLKFQGDEKK